MTDSVVCHLLLLLLLGLGYALQGQHLIHVVRVDPEHTGILRFVVAGRIFTAHGGVVVVVVAVVVIVA